MSARDVRVGIGAWALLVQHDVPTEEPINADHLSTIAVEVSGAEGWSIEEAAKKVAAVYLRERASTHEEIATSLNSTAEMLWVER